MSAAGAIESVKWTTKGSAYVTYKSPAYAAKAIKTLSKTTIDGNSRFMDVLPADEERPGRQNTGGGGTWVQTGGGGGGGNVLALLAAALGGGARGGGGGGWNAGRPAQSWQGKYKVDKSGGDLGEHTGTIKSFAWKTNYGFIECAELAAEYGDVFLHGDEIRSYKQGQTVKFTAVVNKEGKAHAIKLKP